MSFAPHREDAHITFWRNWSKSREGAMTATNDDYEPLKALLIEAQAHSKELRAELDVYRDKDADAARSEKALLQRSLVAEARNKELVEALEEYGIHLKGCGWYTDEPENAESSVCTCGYDAAKDGR